MAKVLFVDDRIEKVLIQWVESGCAAHHILLPLEPFLSIKRTCELVRTLQPDVVLMDHGLCPLTFDGSLLHIQNKPGYKQLISCQHFVGNTVIQALRDDGYTGLIIGNSDAGGEVFTHPYDESWPAVAIPASADKSPSKLKSIMDMYC